VLPVPTIAFTQHLLEGDAGLLLRRQEALFDSCFVGLVCGGSASRVIFDANRALLGHCAAPDAAPRARRTGSGLRPRLPGTAGAQERRRKNLREFAVTRAKVVNDRLVIESRRRREILEHECATVRCYLAIDVGVNVRTHL